LDHLFVAGLIELVDGLGAEVAAADCPLVVLLVEDGAGEAKESSSVGEDAANFTAPTDLAVQPVGCIYSFVLRNSELATRVGWMASLVDRRLDEAE